MSIDIGNPGVNEAAVKAAIGDYTGLVKLASGTITTPIAYLDLELPADYLSFKLDVINMKFSADDVLAMALSQDGGVTFIDGAESYIVSGMFIDAAAGDPGAAVIATVYVDNLADISGDVLPNQSILLNGSFTLFPGNDVGLPQFLACVGCRSDFLLPIFGMMSLNPDAPIAPTLTRANYIRLSPYGNGDANPPTSGRTITSGLYALWGVQ